MRRVSLLLTATMTAALVVVQGAFAAPPADSSTDKAAPAPLVSASVSDPAFDRYVDPTILGRAWAEKDPALLTDAGLQLAEGERVLLRSHKSGITAEDVLKRAANAAADRHDKATLERLARAATQQERKALGVQVAVALKLAGEARAVDPALLVPVDRTTPEDFGLFQQGLRDVQAARITGGRKALDDLDLKWKDLKRDLPAERADALTKLSAEARSALPTDDKEQDVRAEHVTAALDALAAASRDVGNDLADVPTDRMDVPTDRLGGLRGKLSGPSRDTYSTFDDPDPAVWGNGPKKAPPAVHRVNFSIQNNTNYNVAFYLHNTLRNLAPGVTEGYWINAAAGTTPFVRIMQVGGGYKDYTLSDGGTYQFRMNGSWIENMLR